jgi:hypothetical protein
LAYFSTHLFVINTEIDPSMPGWALGVRAPAFRTKAGREIYSWSVRSDLQQDRRRAEEYRLQAGGERGPGSFHATGSDIARGCPGQSSGHGHNQEYREQGQSGRIGWTGVDRLYNNRSFFLGKKLSFRHLVRDRVFPLIKGKFVLQTPPKNRRGERQQAQGEQECTMPIPERFSQSLQHVLS